LQTHLFLPQVLRYHIGQYNTPSALYLSHRYAHLPYFLHALEVLLHDVLDEEVDSPPPDDQALLPSVLSFLSSFPAFLAIILQCTRKTEVRSWRTLFKHLPPPQELFKQALDAGDLKTAGGYLIVVHTLEEEAGGKSSSKQVVEVLRRAKEEGEWELCKELARFLRALDEDGSTLQRALEDVGLASPRKDGITLRTSRLSISSGTSGSAVNGLRLAGSDISHLDEKVMEDEDEEDERSDYFS
jgi:RAB6A-GEF complex partner protein 1